MLTRRQMEIAERLFELDPVHDYPARGAATVAELVGVSGWRLEVGDEVHTGGPAASGPPSVTIALDGNGQRVGTLQLFGGATSEDDKLVARWGARQLARGLRYAQRLDDNNNRRSYEDVQAMLERTPLTPRERDVVGRLLSGASTREISESTGLTVATVNTYLKRIFAKLGVHSRVELVARVTGTRGVIPSEPKKPKKSASASEGESETPSPG